MPQIRPITDLRDTNAISDLCHSSDEPVFITKNGYGDLVVMSMQSYETLLECSETDASITKAEAAYVENGILLDARETLGTLRRKHFG